MPFASINPTNPRTNPWNFHEKIFRIGGAGKWVFFEVAILNFLSRQFWIFFCFISVKNPALLYEVSFFSALWMVFPESWKRSCPNFYAHDCISSVTNKLTLFWTANPNILRDFFSQKIAEKSSQSKFKFQVYPSCQYRKTNCSFVFW